MNIIEYYKDDYTITTDKSKLDIQMVYSFLSGSAYWAKGRSFELVDKSVQNSLCFGVFSQNHQIGFARVVTDYATFAWLCDVFIIEPYRGKGLAKWLIESILEHPEMRSIRRIMLATRDAHELYRKWGNFNLLQSPERWMERLDK